MHHIIPELLSAWANGEPGAFDALVPLIEPHLLKVADRLLRRVKAVGLLSPHDLVQEAYLKLLALPSPLFHDRDHFLAVATNIMRNLALDFTRASTTEKRGGGVPHLDLEAARWVAIQSPESRFGLDAALRDLEKLDPRKRRIVELRFFGGLDNDEMAEELGISPSTVKREWRDARSILFRTLRLA